MREYTKALDAVQEAKEHDAEHQHTKEISQQESKCHQALFAQHSEETSEQTLERAMRDPEIAVSCLKAAGHTRVAD
jgi:stress-induced-phosphoprotein 1